MSTFTFPAKTTKTYGRKGMGKTDLNSTQNLADPEWEHIDPAPGLSKMRQNFFQNHFKMKTKYCIFRHSCFVPRV